MMSDELRKTRGRKPKRKLVDRIVPAWKAQTLLLRAHDCKAPRSIHGFITAAESAKIHRRLLKAIALNSP